MIFLYRFELLRLDGLIADRFPNDYTDAQIPGRQLVLLTNYEEPINFGATEPFVAPFLPTGLTGPVEGWSFVPERIAHDGLRLDSEKAAGQLKVSLPIEHPLSLLFSREDPGATLWLTVATIDDEADTAPLVVWIGRLQSASAGEDRCDLTMSPLRDVMARPGLTRKHPRQCPYALYDATTCGVKAHSYDSATSYWTYREDGLVQSVSADRMTLTVPEAANRANNFFRDGFLVIEPDYSLDGAGQPTHRPRAVGISSAEANAALANGGIRRSIAAHTGNQLTLLTPVLTELPANARITLYAGCSKLPDDANGCKTKFVNFYRYGGYPFIPEKNPFESGIK